MRTLAAREVTTSWIETAHFAAFSQRKHSRGRLPAAAARSGDLDVDLEKETVITGRVVDGSGQAVGGAFVRLLDSSDEFTAEVVASATGDFRFFAAPGTWTLRALSPAGNGDASVAPSGAGIHEVDVKVA